MKGFRKFAATTAGLVAVVAVLGSTPQQPLREKSVTEIADYYGVGLGYRTLPIASINAFLSAQYNLAGFQPQVFSFGAETGAMGAFVMNNLPSTSEAFAFHYYPAQSTGNASQTFKLSGYEFFFDGVSGDFIASEKIVFAAGLSWAFGRLKVVQQATTEESRFTNPYFVPVFRTEFIVLLGNHFLLGLRGLYRHDWSKTGWKQKQGTALPLPGTRLSGASATFFIAIPFLK